jgi:hypothetical protein
VRVFFLPLRNQRRISKNKRETEETVEQRKKKVNFEATSSLREKGETEKEATVPTTTLHTSTQLL